MYSVPYDGSILYIDISKEGVPIEAYEVTILAFVESAGGNTHHAGFFHFSTVTAQGEFEAKLYFRAYDQKAWSYNSENIALPVQKERVVKARISHTSSFEYFGCRVQVVGYRKPPN